MQPIMQKYNIQPDGGIEAQTVATEQWLQEQERNYQCELAAKELGIYESINQLKVLKDGGLLLALNGPARQPLGRD